MNFKTSRYWCEIVMSLLWIFVALVAILAMAIVIFIWWLTRPVPVFHPFSYDPEASAIWPMGISL